MICTRVIADQVSAITPLSDQPSTTPTATSASPTIPDFGHGSSLSQGPSPFTRANVFGIFITIQLCQLTQPYGSLLFRAANGWFWRVSPIASFVEGCIIIMHLLVSRDELLRSRRGFRVLAAALLLVRGNTENQAEEHEDTPLLPASTPRVSGAGSAGAEEAGNAQVTSSTETDSSLAFDGTSMAHKEWRISLFTTLSVVFVFIKICAARGVPSLTAAMAGLLFGWTMVQLLLLLLNWRGLSHSEEAHAKELARKLKKSIRETHIAWQVLFAVLHLPIFGYPSWYLAFKFTLPPALHFLRSTLHFLYAFFCRSIAIASFWHVMSRILTGCPTSCNFEQPLGLGLLLTYPAAIWMIAVGFVESSDFIHDPTCQRIFTHPFHNILRSLFLLLILSGLVTCFSLSIYKASHGASATNFCLTAVLFVVYLVRYESAGTVKPDWTEWLG